MSEGCQNVVGFGCHLVILNFRLAIFSFWDVFRNLLNLNVFALIKMWLVLNVIISLSHSVHWNPTKLMRMYLAGSHHTKCQSVDYLPFLNFVHLLNETVPSWLSSCQMSKWSQIILSLSWIPYAQDVCLSYYHIKPTNFTFQNWRQIICKDAPTKDCSYISSCISVVGHLCISQFFFVLLCLIVHHSWSARWPLFMEQNASSLRFLRYSTLDKCPKP